MPWPVQYTRALLVYTFDDPGFDPGMAAPSALGLGKVSNAMPFLTRLTAKYVKGKVETVAKATAFVDKVLLSNLSDAERRQMEQAPPELVAKLQRGYCEGLHQSCAMHRWLR